MSDLNHWNKYLECQVEHANRKNQKGVAVKPKPFVTIARQTGAGGTTIAHKVVDLMRELDKDVSCPWIVVNKSLAERVLEEHHLPSRLAEFMPEAKISEIRDMTEDLFGLHPPQWTLVHKTAETILHMAQMGKTVIVGRGGNFITRRLPGGLHVRLIGSKKKRIEHAQTYYRLDPKEAPDFVEKEEKDRAHYVKEYFGKDIDSPLHYDLVINTDHISFDDAARLIAEEALRRA